MHRAGIWTMLICVAAHRIQSIKCVDEMEDFPLDVDDELKNLPSLDEINGNENASSPVVSHKPVDLNGLTSSGGQVKLFNQLMTVAMKRPGAKQKLAQVLPIIRAMSPSQRLTLATLVLRQMMASKSTQPPNYQQLMEKSDNRSSELMIPISLDIASIFNPAAKDAGESGRSSVFGTYYYNPLSAGYRVSGPPPQRPPPLYNIRRFQMQNSRRKDDVPPEMMPPPYSSPSNASYANFDQKRLPQGVASEEDLPDEGEEDEDESVDEEVQSDVNDMSGNKDCVPYVNNLCIDVRSYPNKDILNTIRNLEQKHVFRALVEDFTRNNVTVDMPEMERRHGNEDNENLHICATKVKYARPKKAKSMHGTWKYVVNTERYTQTVRLETCLNADKSCSYLNENVKSHCTQIYNYHRLLTWDEKSGLSLDLFKIPTCCACQIQQITPFVTSTKKHLHKPDVGIQENVILDEASVFHSTMSKPRSKSKPNGGPLIPKRDSFGRPRRPPPILPIYQEGNDRLPAPPQQQQTPPQQPNRYSPNDNSIRRTSHKNIPPKGVYIVGKGTMIENAEVESTTPSHRVNYNYHPIIDFFNPASSQAPKEHHNIDRADAIIDEWQPMTEGPRALQN